MDRLENFLFAKNELCFVTFSDCERFIDLNLTLHIKKSFKKLEKKNLTVNSLSVYFYSVQHHIYK